MTDTSPAPSRPPRRALRRRARDRRSPVCHAHGSHRASAGSLAAGLPVRQARAARRRTAIAPAAGGRGRWPGPARSGSMRWRPNSSRTSRAPCPASRSGSDCVSQHDPHWHTYWRNPGDSGLPTRFEPHRARRRGLRRHRLAGAAPARDRRSRQLRLRRRGGAGARSDPAGLALANRPRASKCRRSGWCARMSAFPAKRRSRSSCRWARRAQAAAPAWWSCSTTSASNAPQAGRGAARPAGGSRARGRYAAAAGRGRRSARGVLPVFRGRRPAGGAAVADVGQPGAGMAPAGRAGSARSSWTDVPAARDGRTGKAACRSRRRGVLLLDGKPIEVGLQPLADAAGGRAGAGGGRGDAVGTGAGARPARPPDRRQGSTAAGRRRPLPSPGRRRAAQRCDQLRRVVPASARRRGCGRPFPSPRSAAPRARWRSRLPARCSAG